MQRFSYESKYIVISLVFFDDAFDEENSLEIKFIMIRIMTTLYNILYNMYTAYAYTIQY